MISPNPRGRRRTLSPGGASRLDAADTGILPQLVHSVNRLCGALVPAGNTLPHAVTA